MDLCTFEPKKPVYKNNKLSIALCNLGKYHKKMPIISLILGGGFVIAAAILTGTAFVFPLLALTVGCLAGTIPYLYHLVKEKNVNYPSLLADVLKYKFYKDAKKHKRWMVRHNLRLNKLEKQYNKTGSDKIGSKIFQIIVLMREKHTKYTQSLISTKNTLSSYIGEAKGVMNELDDPYSNIYYQKRKDIDGNVYEENIYDSLPQENIDKTKQATKNYKNCYFEAGYYANDLITEASKLCTAMNKYNAIGLRSAIEESLENETIKQRVREENNLTTKKQEKNLTNMPQYYNYIEQNIENHNFNEIFPDMHLKQNVADSSRYTNSRVEELKDQLAVNKSIGRNIIKKATKQMPKNK